MKLVDWAQLEVVFIPSCPSLLQDPPEKPLRSLGAFQSLGWSSGNSGTSRVSPIAITALLCLWMLGLPAWSLYPVRLGPPGMRTTEFGFRLDGWKFRMSAHLKH